MSSADWEALDFAAVSALLSGWVPSPLPSTNWKGIVHESEDFDPQPAPSRDASQPTVFAVWDLDYTKLDPSMDSTEAAPRWGEVIVGIYSQPGALIGPILAAAQALRALFVNDPAARLSFSPDLALPRRVGRKGPWYVRGLRIPFCTGAA